MMWYIYLIIITTWKIDNSTKILFFVKTVSCTGVEYNKSDNHQRFIYGEVHRTDLNRARQFVSMIHGSQLCGGDVFSFLLLKEVKTYRMTDWII